MLVIEKTGQFKKDYKRELKGNYRETLDADLVKVLKMLINKQPLARKYNDHALTGNWKDFRDCHIKSDLILIYRISNTKSLQLVRLGSHSELGL